MTTNSWSSIQNIKNWRSIYFGDPCEAKYQILIRILEDVATKDFNDSKAFIEYSNNMVNIYKNIEDYNPNEKHENITCFWWYDWWYASW